MLRKYQLLTLMTTSREFASLLEAIDGYVGRFEFFLETNPTRFLFVRFLRPIWSSRFESIDHDQHFLHIFLDSLSDLHEVFERTQKGEEE